MYRIYVVPTLNLKQDVSEKNWQRNRALGRYVLKSMFHVAVKRTGYRCDVRAGHDGGTGTGKSLTVDVPLSNCRGWTAICRGLPANRGGCRGAQVLVKVQRGFLVLRPYIAGPAADTDDFLLAAETNEVTAD